MTPREEYTEAAEWIARIGTVYTEERDLAVRVLRAIGDGAVLCKRLETHDGAVVNYIPLEQP